MYVIYSNEDFDSIYGKIKKGDILETCMHEDEQDFIKYILDNYGPNGQNIKVKWKKIKGDDID